MALGEDRPGDAYRLVYEALRENPEHPAALTMLRSAESDSSIEVRRATTADSLLDWERGRYWLVTSPHFEIETNVARGDEAKQIAQRLEQLHTVWRQVFFDYWIEGATGTFRFERPHLPAPRMTARHRVVVFRDRQEYVVRLTALRVSGAGISKGFYADEQKRSFFYAGEEAAYGTWYHETTHQLFQETGATVDAVAKEGDVWLVEGAAMYMESLQERDGVVTVGGFDARRLQYARHRRLVDKFHKPLAELARMGRAELAADEDIGQLYSEACGLAHFLMDYEQGKYRTATIELLKEIYAGRARSDSLAALTGTPLEQLDAQYESFLTDVDDEDLAKYLMPAERLTALALPRTARHRRRPCAPRRLQEPGVARPVGNRDHRRGLRPSRRRDEARAAQPATDGDRRSFAGTDRDVYPARRFEPGPYADHGRRAAAPDRPAQAEGAVAGGDGSRRCRTGRDRSAGAVGAA